MIEQVAHLLDRCADSESVMPPTELYNEGWLLRIALDWFSAEPFTDSPFSFAPGATWYSEGLLASAFLARSRGDDQAEGFTHADGTIGHFSVSPGVRSEIRPEPDATQLVVIEAKLGSPLSAGTKNAREYDQAARNAACLVHIASEAGVAPTLLSRYALYIVAPETQVNDGIFGTLVTKQSIESKVRERADRYGGDKAIWFSETFLPYFENLHVGLVTWEQIIDGMGATSFAEEYRDFYSRCCSLVPRLANAT